MKLAALFLLLLSVGWTTNLVSVKGPGYPYPCVKLVKDINLNGSSVDNENIFNEEGGAVFRNPQVVFKGSVYFGATAGIINKIKTGVQLWKTDGTEAGTVLVKTIYPGGNAYPDQFTVVGETLFFVATNASAGREIWKTDGTTAGTVLVKDINPGGELVNPPTYLRNVNGTLFFTADDTPDYTRNYKLWKSDGTTAGTVAVKDINNNDALMQRTIYQPIAVINGVYYYNYNGLRRSDGTAAGTYKVKNGISDPEHLTVSNGKLFFRADDGVHGSELWKSDGTAAGTVMVKDILPGSGSSTPTNFFSDGTTLYFWGSDKNGIELWKSNGTAAGTFMVKNIHPKNHSGPNNYATYNETLFFRANDGVHGYELWKSNGTAAGTILVKNINDPLDGLDTEENGGSYPRWFQERNGKLYFSAERFYYGRELWVTDGTTAGTVMVKDINPTGSSSPTHLIVVNNKLIFFADDGVHGRELFSYGLCGVNFPTTPEGRVAATSSEDLPDLKVSVLENPVHHTITAEVSGVMGQPVSFYLTDLQGRPLQKRTIEAGDATERQVFEVEQQARGILLLRVVAGSRSRTVRVITTN